MRRTLILVALLGMLALAAAEVSLGDANVFLLQHMYSINTFFISSPIPP